MIMKVPNKKAINIWTEANMPQNYSWITRIMFLYFLEHKNKTVFSTRTIGIYVRQQLKEKKISPAGDNETTLEDGAIGKARKALTNRNIVTTPIRATTSRTEFILTSSGNDLLASFMSEEDGLTTAAYELIEHIRMLVPSKPAKHYLGDEQIDATVWQDIFTRHPDIRNKLRVEHDKTESLIQKVEKLLE